MSRDAASNPGFVLMPPGALSRSGVLDVGLRCAHSCRFCYYSFMAGAKGQHEALRQAPFRSTADCLAIVEGLAANGLINFDITGGEPTMHEGLPEMVRLGRELGLGVRVITLGQFLLRKKGPHLLDTLLEAGVTDFLFSLHAAGEDSFRAATGGSLARVLEAMSALDAAGFQYSANTVVHSGNLDDLPRIAELAAGHGVYHHNFIAFNAYYRWDSPAGIAGLQAAYADVADHLRRAVGILDAAGAAVTIRYLPLCVVPDLARHVAGVTGVHHDPHEWMNRAGNPDREPEYCAEVLDVPVDGPRDIYALREGARELDFGADGRVRAVAVRGEDFKVFPEGCAPCPGRAWCDGLDPKYILLRGQDGLTPLAQLTGRGPLLDIRRSYLPAFALKLGAGADMRGLLARLLGRCPLPDKPLVSILVGPGEEAAVRATLAGAWAQDYPEVEVLLCSGGYGGPGAALNRAATGARGAILAFLMAGEVPEPSLARACVEFLTENPQAGQVQTDVLGADGRVRPAPEFDFQDLLDGDRAHRSLILRAQAFADAGGFTQGLTDCLSWDLRLRAAALGHTGLRLPRPLLRLAPLAVSQDTPQDARLAAPDRTHAEFAQVRGHCSRIFPRDPGPERAAKELP